MIELLILCLKKKIAPNRKGTQSSNYDEDFNFLEPTPPPLFLS